MGHDIYQATDFEFLPFRALSPHNPPHPVEAHLLALVRSHLHGGNFLLSYTWDLTRRLQIQWDNREDDASKAFWQVVRKPLCFSLLPDNNICFLRLMIASFGIGISKYCLLDFGTEWDAARFLQTKFIDTASSNPNSTVCALGSLTTFSSNLHFNKFDAFILPIMYGSESAPLTVVCIHNSY